MSIQSVKADNGRNLYVRLTDYVFDDEIELGCVFAFDHPPVTTATTGEHTVCLYIQMCVGS